MDVVGGRQIAGPLVRLSCQRHLNDLKDGPRRGLMWDWSAAERVIGYFRDVLRLNGGEHEGRPFELESSQVFIVGSLFGWKRVDGSRRFRVAFCEIGKGNGKSPLAAGVGMYMLTADGESRAEVYSAAHDKDQANILFRDAVAMVDQSPELDERIIRSGGRSREWNLATRDGCFFRPISSEHRGAAGKSGPRPHCVLLDEIHEHPTNFMVEFMSAGTKGRRQALIFMITNSGFDRQTVCWDYHKYAKEVLEGLKGNDSFFAYVCGLDDGDDWRDEKVWEKANPLINVSIPTEYLRKQVTEAEGMPSKQGTVRRLNFCEWTEAEAPWISKPVWDAVQVEGMELEDYRGRDCFAAVDLSSKRDLTALGAVIPLDDGSLAAFVHFWTPEDGLLQREQQDGVTYRLWRDRGFLTVTPGPVVDYSYVARELVELGEIVKLHGVACDTYKRDALQIELDDLNAGIELVNHPQGFRKSSASDLWMPSSVEATEEAIIKRTIRIAANQCLEWNAASVVMRSDEQGNKKPDKKKATGRVDGIVALIMAVGMARAKPAVQPKHQMFVVGQAYA